ncbi:MAG: membrane protein insertion efficiency factor YidD [Pontimonas sp.]
MSSAIATLALLPRNVAIAFMLGYRKVISPLYGQVCRYYPSCSLYALRAIQYHGALRGIGLSAWRVVRCNPFTRGGIDDPPEGLKPHYELTPMGFVRLRKEV